MHGEESVVKTNAMFNMVYTYMVCAHGVRSYTIIILLWPMVLAAT